MAGLLNVCIELCPALITALFGEAPFGGVCCLGCGWWKSAAEICATVCTATEG